MRAFATVKVKVEPPRLDLEDLRLLGKPMTRSLLGCALSVHKELGPGLLESAYRKCLAHELAESGFAIRQEQAIPIVNKGVSIDCGYRADIIVEECILLELKATERLLPIHDAQLMTYMRIARLRVGLLMNFNMARLQQGIRRFVL